jgi:hypothetical protein
MQVKVCAERARPASALPISRPGAVFARDESAGPRARNVTAERILLIEDDFLVAAQIEAGSQSPASRLRPTKRSSLHRRSGRPCA